MDRGKLTPLMQQFWDVKDQHPDKILFFRMGDFYEMFHEDAEIAAPILGIALTSRNKSKGLEIPMCGVPHHSIGPHINKLLSEGHKVAICDQLEDPSQTKGIVKRGVTRVVTPGLVYDPETLDGSQSNFIGAITKKGESFDLTVADGSTGEVRSVPDLDVVGLSLWVTKLEVKELLIPKKFELPFQYEGLITPRDSQFESGEDRLLEYISETQGPEAKETIRPTREFEKKFLQLPLTTLKGLEIFKASDGEKKGSLFETINKTKTPMGARLLKGRLQRPSLSATWIQEEHKQVGKFLKEDSLRQSVVHLLGKIGDLERKVGRLSNPLCNARDLRNLAVSLEIACQAEQAVGHPLNKTLNHLAQKIQSELREELPLSTKDGGLIAKGVNTTLDEYVDVAANGQKMLSELEVKERQATGIQSLKIKFNNVYGYSFEVTKTNLSKVPKHFVRKQTLAQAERFISTELTDLEQKILASQRKRNQLELKLYGELRQLALRQAQEMFGLVERIAEIDLHCGFAYLASVYDYCQPSITDGDIDIKRSRHPVIESLSTESFIANDIQIKKGDVLLLTGPNMAGKSTIMRQVALAGILNQIGCFTPASQARLPLFDQIFTRIGASDHLSQGQSTFMVEMVETSEIIDNATVDSLVILDEIGRGTSTYDGMSLAQAVLEYFAKNLGCYTFFATHYHELTKLSEEHTCVHNGHMEIKEHEGRLVFLRKLRSGPANKSYGIEVAKHAGLPKAITERAKDLLDGLTQKAQELNTKQMDLFASSSGDLEKLKASHLQVTERLQKLSEVVAELDNLDINNLTPIMALNQLGKLQHKLKEHTLN